MRKVLLGVMLSLLTIATCFVTSCTKVNNYGPSTPRFELQDSVKLTVIAPTDSQFPLSGEVEIVVSTSGTSAVYKLDRTFPPSTTQNTTEYSGYIATSTSTSFVTVHYCSVNYNLKKVISYQYELTGNIKL